LEIQHVHGIDAVALPDPRRAGYAGVTFSGVPDLKQNSAGLMVTGEPPSG